MAKWLVKSVRKSWSNYVPELAEYVGQVLEEKETSVGMLGGICLYVPDRSDWWWFEVDGLEQEPVFDLEPGWKVEIPEKPRNKYMREIAPGVWIDVYDVIYAFEVTDPCLQHAIKKLLAAGKRGHKDFKQDLIDIRDSVNRAIEHYDGLQKAD